MTPDDKAIEPWGLDMPDFSPDGSKIAFATAETLMDTDVNPGIDVYVYDRASRSVELVSKPATQFITLPVYENSSPRFSPDGKKLMFFSSSPDFVVGDNNNSMDLFIKDFDNGGISLASKSPSGVLGNGGTDRGVWLDNSRILLRTYARNLSDEVVNSSRQYYIKNISNGSVKHLSFNGEDGGVPNAPLGSANSIWDISLQSSQFIFSSSSSNLVTNDTNNSYDIFILNYEDDSLARVSTDSLGQELPEFDGQEDDGSTEPTISADGTKIAFISSSPNLVDNDTNGNADLFVKDLATGAVTRVNTRIDGTEAPAASTTYRARFSPDGSKVAFLHHGIIPGHHLVPNVPAQIVLYVRDLITGELHAASLITTEANFLWLPISPAWDYTWTDYGILFASGILLVENI